MFYELIILLGTNYSLGPAGGLEPFFFESANAASHAANARPAPVPAPKPVIAALPAVPPGEDHNQSSRLWLNRKRKGPLTCEQCSCDRTTSNSKTKFN